MPTVDAGAVRPVAAPAPIEPGAMRNRVLSCLVVASLVAGAAWPFLAHAPNRLLSGVGIPLSQVLGGWRAVLALLPAAVLAACAAWPASNRLHAVTAVSASFWLAGLAWLAGHHAAVLAAAGTPLSRTSFGGGFWVLAVLAWLAVADALRRLPLRAPARTAAHAALALPLLLLGATGQLDALSLLKEYANRRDVFHDAWVQHLRIVATTLAFATPIGLLLGTAAWRSRSLAVPMLAVLNIVQTLPSIALFGLLMAPLALLSTAFPSLGLSSVGTLPALIALTLYSLVPIVHGTCAGLAQAPHAAVDAARGVGFTPRQVFWRVRVPLALPLLLSGLRVTAVQAVGLAVVAALIGAGGLGAVMFQGLLSSALDLVLLGALPVVALAVLLDSAFNLLSGLMPRGLASHD